MPLPASRLLVVDTSVARSCGEAKHPRSKLCRDTLQAILNICHRIALSTELKREFGHVKQQFFLTWRTAMRSRGKVEKLPKAENPALREEIQGALLPVKNRAGRIARMLKDVHLIEAALATEGIILSLDEKARGDFRDAAASVDQLGGLVWVNPEKASENALDWLHSGAPPEAPRRLDFNPNEPL